MFFLFRSRRVRIRVSSPRRSLTGWLAGWLARLPDGSPMNQPAGQVRSSQPFHGRGKSFAPPKKKVLIFPSQSHQTGVKHSKSALLLPICFVVLHGSRESKADLLYSWAGSMIPLVIEIEDVKTPLNSQSAESHNGAGKANLSNAISS